VSEIDTYADAAAWTAGPQPVYDRLAERAVDELRADLTGLLALDAGAGTGAATRALRRRGADVVAVDTSPAMLAELVRQTGGLVPTICANICSIPVPDDTYDVAIAAYVINHLDAPTDALAELGRVTKAGGSVVATTFGADDHPIKPAVDEVLMRHGFVYPDWYAKLKQAWMPRIATAPALTEVGRKGGLRDVTVHHVDVDLSEFPAEAAAAYRLGLSYIAPFLQGLDADVRRLVEAEAVAVVRTLPPLWLPMLVLSGRAP
jgi:SAM-dependent methyltransferase